MTQSTLVLLPAAVAVIGLVQTYFGWWAVNRHESQAVSNAVWKPPITILKPLHGAEPMLEQALASFCDQDYQNYQIVFGLQEAGDPAFKAGPFSSAVAG